MSIRVTAFAHYKAKQGVLKQLSLQEFADLCATSYPAKKKQPLYVPDALPGDSRASGNKATAATAVFLDFDAPALSIDEAAGRLKGLKAEFVLYPTYSWGADKPKYRIVLPLAKPIPLEQRRQLIARMETLLPGIAPESRDTKRGYFVGRNGRDDVPPPISRKGQPADRVAWPAAEKPAVEKKGEVADVAKALVKKLGRPLQDNEGRWSAVEYLATRVSARDYTEEQCYALLNTLIEKYFDPEHVTDEDRKKWEGRIAYWLKKDRPKKDARAAAAAAAAAESLPKWDIAPRRDVLDPSAAPLPRFEEGLFPKVIEGFAQSCGLDPLPVALLALAACGAAIGAHPHLRIQAWQPAFPVLHLFVHGLPSVGKSAVFSATTRGLEELQGEIVRRNTARFLEHAEKKRKGEPVAPLYKEPLLYASDITSASMVDCLEGNSHGLALLNDEARGMLAALSSTSGDAREDRSALLALRDGKARTVVRRSRNFGAAASCPRWIGNVMLAAPTRVAEEVMLKNKDGLLSRFTMVYLEPTEVPAPSAEANESAAAYEQLLRDLYGSRLLSDNQLELGNPALEVLLSGQRAYRAWALRIAADDEDMSERFGKAAQDAASIALILALVEAGEEPDRLAAAGTTRRRFSAPDARQMERAFDITDLMLKYNEAFCWRGIKNRPGLELAQHLARFVVRGDFLEFTTRDISRTVDKWNSTEERNVGLRDSIRRTALEILIDDGWIQADGPWLIGDKLRRGVTWLVNPAVRAMENERTTERKRKDDTAQAIARSAAARRQGQK